MLSHFKMSKEPVRVDLGSFEYSQKEQKNSYIGGMPLEATSGGTQTYGSSGQPCDSDYD